MHTGVREVSFGSRSTTVTVPRSVYLLLRKLAFDNGACSVCGKRYTKINPKVSLNLCLRCLSESDGKKFLGLYEHVDPDPLYIDDVGRDDYAFLDGRNFVHISSTNRQGLILSHHATLRHWKYTVPQFITDDEEQQHATAFHGWEIFGKPGIHSALLVSYNGPHDILYFFLCRSEGAELVSRRKGRLRTLLIEARRRLEETKLDPANEGSYNVNGHLVYSLSESYIFEMVSQIASEEAASQPRLLL